MMHLLIFCFCISQVTRQICLKSDKSIVMLPVRKLWSSVSAVLYFVCSRPQQTCACCALHSLHWNTQCTVRRVSSQCAVPDTLALTAYTVNSQCAVLDTLALTASAVSNRCAVPDTLALTANAVSSWCAVPDTLALTASAVSSRCAVPDTLALTANAVSSRCAVPDTLALTASAVSSQCAVPDTLPLTANATSAVKCNLLIANIIELFSWCIQKEFIILFVFTWKYFIVSLILIWNSCGSFCKHCTVIDIVITWAQTL